MSSQKRAPTESTTKVDPSIEIHKNLYPYLNYNQGGFAPYAGMIFVIKDSLKRAVSSINPFAVQQVSTSDRIAVGARNGARWYFPDVFFAYNQGLPQHYSL